MRLKYNAQILEGHALALFLVTLVLCLCKVGLLIRPLKEV